MAPVSSSTSVPEIWRWLADIPDPEIPAISIVDLGIVRNVEWRGEQGDLVVTVTPTYSGCPATEVIADSIRQVLEDHGISRSTIKTQLSPAWTTDWMAPAARERLRGYGIAPPNEHVVDVSRILRRPAKKAAAVHCPRCGSDQTEVVSQFGSTPCKALYRCVACREPFDYFKPH